jgi:hypothetical protein
MLHDDIGRESEYCKAREKIEKGRKGEFVTLSRSDSAVGTTCAHCVPSQLKRHDIHV